MNLSNEQRALVASALRWILAALIGALGIKATEAQISEAAVAIVTLAALGASLYWSRKSDQNGKDGPTPPPTATGMPA